MEDNKEVMSFNRKKGEENKSEVTLYNSEKGVLDTRENKTEVLELDLGDFDIITVDTGVSNIATLDTQAICDLLSDYVKVSIVDNASITKKVLEGCSYSNVNFSTNGCELPALYLSVFYLDYIKNAHTVRYYKSNMEKASQLTKEFHI